MKILLSFPWLLYATTKGSSPSTPSKFLLFIVLLPFVDDPVSTLPEAIFLNKLVFLPYFYHLMISSSDLANPLAGGTPRGQSCPARRVSRFCVLTPPGHDHGPVALRGMADAITSPGQSQSFETPQDAMNSHLSAPPRPRCLEGASPARAHHNHHGNWPAS